MSVNDQSLPIKVIRPNQGLNRKVLGGGGKIKPFGDFRGDIRSSFQRQIKELNQAVLAIQGSKPGVVPLRLELIPKALAKSHRPKKLFTEDTCPIIGAGKLGELYLRATSSGLGKLEDMVIHDDSDQAKKELTSIERIEIVTPDDRRRKTQPTDILRQCPRTDGGFVTRVRLFDFGRELLENTLSEFNGICKTRKLAVTAKGYSPSSLMYSVECRDADDIETLSHISGVRAITAMPMVSLLRPSIFNRRATPFDLPTRAVDDVPVVVVVDTGVTSNNPALESWVVGRESMVAPAYRNDEHGTFVAGLICFGSQLNPNLKCINSDPCAVFDLQVMPNSDPSKGERHDLTEQELLQSLESALQKYAGRYRVWNISLNSKEVCSLDEFSPLAEQLDNLQEQYGVSFVISAGNFGPPPLLDYPRTQSQISAGRITSPADSVLGITVGLVSHIDYTRRGPKQHHPSPFSRHGSGPNHIIKPDLVHFGGTCSTDLAHVAGISSINQLQCADDLGTSFSTPLVARTLAQICHEISPPPSPVLARAILTHHARDPRNGRRVPDGEENFLGFGMPIPPPYCLQCDANSCTLVFEDSLRPGYHLDFTNFPYPSSLQKDGKFFGEISMTVAFSPIRSSKWGSEYCEAHIEAKMGLIRDKYDPKSKKLKERFFGMVPPEHIDKGKLYEEFQVRELRKWAPVRTYHRSLGKGERGKRWHLMLSLLLRHDVEKQQQLKNQPFGLLVTISDPEGKAPVYDEMTQMIRTRFEADNLAIRSAARARARG